MSGRIPQCCNEQATGNAPVGPSTCIHNIEWYVQLKQRAKRTADAPDGLLIRIHNIRWCVPLVRQASLLYMPQLDFPSLYTSQAKCLASAITHTTAAGLGEFLTCVYAQHHIVHPICAIHHATNRKFLGCTWG